MATTQTTKIAEAISLLSDVLSTEVAAANHFLEDEEETVSTDDYNQVMDSAVEFATAQLEVLETLKHEIEDEVGSDDWTVDGWDIDDDDEDDVGNGTVVVEGDSEESAEEETPEPTDEEKITALTTANEELADQIAELEAEKEGLTQTLKSALDSVDELIDASEAQQTYMETC
tara:strand:- start:604 stop:1122 length:519 start_codon:yes stop_codon:yes gene_type:complete